MNVSEIARVCHEANRQLQLIANDPAIPVSQPCENLDDETKRSAVDGVMYAIDNNPTPEESHENWCEFKENNGWTWGPKKDTEKKQHPLLCDYDDVPEFDKMKDKLFLNIVQALKPV